MVSADNCFYITVLGTKISVKLFFYRSANELLFESLFIQTNYIFLLIKYCTFSQFLFKAYCLTQNKENSATKRKRKKNIIHQWDSKVCSIRSSPLLGPQGPILDNQYFTNGTIFCLCENSSSDDGFTIRQDEAFCAGRIL